MFLRPSVLLVLSCVAGLCGGAARHANGTAHEHAPTLVVLKASRSGSTWFYWLLGEIRNEQEQHIFTQYEAQSCVNSTAQLEDYMTEYLTKQTRLYDNRKRCLANTLLKHCCNVAKEKAAQLGLLALTVHPFHDPPGSMDFDQWLRIINSEPNVRLVVYIRSNVVKWAISHAAVKEQLKVCKTHKVKVGNECLEQLNATLTLDPHSLRKRISSVVETTHALKKLGKRLARDVGGSLLVVTYEELQLNYMSALRSVALHTGFGHVSRSDALKNDEQKYAKRGKEDLRAYLANYDAIERDLQAYPCLLEQLRSDKPQNFDLCELPDDFNKKSTVGNDDDDDVENEEREKALEHEIDSEDAALRDFVASKRKHRQRNVLSVAFVGSILLLLLVCLAGGFLYIKRTLFDYPDAPV